VSRVFLTGGTGFIGSRVAVKLHDRGDDLVALVRDPARAAKLSALGCELVAGEVIDQPTMANAMRGADAVIHCAGVYRVGIPAAERPAMYAANVTGTERVLDAAVEAGVPRIVYVSTVNAFGNTRGRVVDETYRRDASKGFLSSYDETKYLAHRAAEDRASKGAPVVIVQPGGVYGPGDHSEVGNLVDQIRTGRLKFRTYPDLGFNFVYVDDAVAGILLALEKGRVGESYVLGGEITTMGHVTDVVAELSGRKPPRFTMPSWAIKSSLPFAPPGHRDDADAAEPPGAHHGRRRRDVLGHRREGPRPARLRAPGPSNRPGPDARSVRLVQAHQQLDHRSLRSRSVPPRLHEAALLQHPP
jgi:nucleoside-diphosphate-sugar epimerase